MILGLFIGASIGYMIACFTFSAKESQHNKILENEAAWCDDNCKACNYRDDCIFCEEDWD